MALGRVLTTMVLDYFNLETETLLNQHRPLADGSFLGWLVMLNAYTVGCRLYKPHISINYCFNYNAC